MKDNDKYQINKTLRFGLTLNEQAIKQEEKGTKSKSHQGTKSESHRGIEELVQNSYQNLQEKCESNHKDWNEKQSIDDITEIFNRINGIDGIKGFQTLWSEFYHRYDQIAVTKDFYRSLTKKARFDEGKQAAQIIKLSSLQKERKYIIDYWKDNLDRQLQSAKDFEKLLKQYQDALGNASQNHTKPNLINFSKSFVSLINLVNQVLIPVSENTISFPNSHKITDKDKNLQELANGQWLDLVRKIKEIKEILKANGGYTPFGRVTLNPYTAKQKPHDFLGEIKDIVNYLKLKELIEELLGKSEEDKVEQYFKGLDKKSTFENKKNSTIIRAQCFKYKPIPVLVRSHLAEYLAKTMAKDKDKICTVLNSIGKHRSIAQDYKELPKNFNLKEYPIKVAFDYAWESLARAKYATDLDFPQKQCKKQCKQFLNDFYKIQGIEEDKNFQLYAKLLYISENLATLEHSEPSNPDQNINNIKNAFEGITLHGDHKKCKDTILKAIENCKSLKKDSAFQTAKRQLGRFRGQQREMVQCVKKECIEKDGKKGYSYENPYIIKTNKFKQIASDFGKKFADLRDKFLEQNEVAKIAYFGIIIEDANKDRYVLINPLEKDEKSSKNKQERSDFVDTVLNKLSNQGEYKTYQVKSLTSKALQKIIANKKTYPDFHQDKAIIKGKNKNFIEGTDNLDNLKKALTNSKMAKDQQWSEFKLAIDQCKDYQAIEKEIDQKAYALEIKNINRQNLECMVNNKGALLLPIVNQDITSENRQNKNQFSKDWANIFDCDTKEFRLHPEFNISYRTPTPGYPKHKRFGRLQFIAQFNCELIPQSGDYLNRKEQLSLVNQQESLQKKIDELNKTVTSNLGNDYKIIGIDRGIKQLATLCVLDADGKINDSGFDIYKKEFDDSKKQWVHTLEKPRYILDLSNLRLETTIDGKKVLVDQNLTLVKEKRNAPNEKANKENQQKIKLKQLSYIRKWQFALQTQEQDVLDICKNGISDEELRDKIKEAKIISPYGEGKAYADLPIAKFREIVEDYKKAKNENNELEKRKIIELDHADDLKRGIVANIVGVVNFIMQKFDYKVYLSLENLSRAWGGSTDGLDGRYLPPTNQDEDMDFKQQQNQMLAGLGTYQFFEMQLLNKLWKVQQEKNIPLIPPFRSKSNYEDIRKFSSRDKESDKVQYVCKPFGIVRFVDPKFTSSKCPVCDKNYTNRDANGGNIFKCLYNIDYRENNKSNKLKWSETKQKDYSNLDQEKECKFLSSNSKEDNTPYFDRFKKSDKNLEYILNGDDNGAYHIALKTLENLKYKD